jgi:large subunit ribosomal protein L49
MGRTKGFITLKKAAEEFTNFVPPKVREKIKAPPAQKALYNKTTQIPLPLTYKLQEMPSSGLHGPALGVSSPLPFSVLRTHLGNLPVYTEYKNDRNHKKTVIRRLSGNIDEFKTELSKIVSNYEISEKIGRVEVKGIHTEVVKTWLRRLGF